MATISFRYTPDFDDNKNCNSAACLLATVDYSVEIPVNMPITVDDLQLYFNQWLRGLGYEIK